MKEDNIKGSTVAHGTFEWLPIWLWKGGTIPIGSFNIRYNWTPELMVQYDHTNEATKTIAFSGERQSLRIGPEAVLWLRLDAPTAALQSIFQKTTARVVYHWWAETYSGRKDSWLDASLTHNLDADGFVALKFAYRNGRNEDTGVRTDLYKITLSAKTCTDVFSKDPC